MVAKQAVDEENIGKLQSLVTAEGVAVTTLQQQVASLNAQEQATSNTANQVINCSVKPTKLAHKSFYPIFTRLYLSTRSTVLFRHSACKL